jgi:hypothetical protein
MVESDNTNVELANFYDQLYRQLGLDSLVVPGPLVPLFASIALSSSPHEWIGNICPALPPLTGSSARNGYLFPVGIYYCLPSIPFILDQIHDLPNVLGITQTAPNGSEPHYLTYWQSVFTMFGQTVDDTNASRFNIVTPNARYPTFVPFSAAIRFLNHKITLNLPTRLTAGPTRTNTMMSYLQLFGFERYDTQNGTNWLTTVGPIMSVYSTFFQGSVSLLSISPTGLGASLPLSKYNADSLIVPDDVNVIPAVVASAGPPAVTATPVHQERRIPANNKVTINHAAPPLSELAEQYAALSLVNCDFTDTANASAGLNGPANATLRSGHYWTLPNVRTAHEVNTYPGLANNVASYYHSPVPVRK